MVVNNACKCPSCGYDAVRTDAESTGGNLIVSCFKCLSRFRLTTNRDGLYNAEKLPDLWATAPKAAPPSRMVYSNAHPRNIVSPLSLPKWDFTQGRK